MICAKANTPISTGRNGTPPSSQPMPSVRRGCPITGSLPSTVTTQPIAPESSPLVSELSTRPATIDSARTKSAKYSHGPNLSANSASGPVAATSTTAPSSPPKHRGPDAEPQRPPGLAVARHREAVEGRRHRRGLAGNAEQARGDQTAGFAADVNADHARQALQRLEAESERQHHDHRHGDGDARQRAADHADQRADEKRHQVLDLQDVDEAGTQQLEHQKFVQRPRGSSTVR